MNVRENEMVRKTVKIMRINYEEFVIWLEVVIGILLVTR